MARLINNVNTTTLFMNINVVHDDDSVEIASYKVGDEIKNLRYVENEEVKTVSGVLKEIKIRQVGKPKYTNASTVEDTFGRDVQITSITLDASKKYASNIVKINAMEIVEDAGVENVKMVYVTPSIVLDLNMFYSDNTEDHTELRSGAMLKDVVIMNAIKGKEDITGDFMLGGFTYTLNQANTAVVINGFALIKDGNVALYGLSRLIRLGNSLPPVKIASAEALAEAIANLEDGGVLVATSDIAFTENVEIPAGKEIVIDMQGHEITVPEPVNGRSIYAIDNYGKLTIENLVVSCRGIENMPGGEMTINNCDITARDTGGAALWTEPGSKTVINGGTFRQTHVGSPSDSYGSGCINNSGELIINDVTIESVSMRTYAIITGGDEASLEVNGDITVNGCHGGISNDGGLLTINGGVFTSSRFYGLYSSCDRIGVDGEAVVVVNDGTFDGPNYSVWLGSDVYSPVNVLAKINGGTFLHPLKIQDNVSDDGKHGIQIYGGRFKDPVPEEYVAEGYYATDEPNAEGFYTVQAGTKPTPVTPDPEPEVDPAPEG